MKHIRQALIFFTNQIADRVTTFTKIQQTVGGTTVTHFVIQTRQRNIIALTNRAIVVNSVLGH